MSSNDDLLLGNPYLALREAKIKRNEARLRELGLIERRMDESPNGSSPVVASGISRKKLGVNGRSSNETPPSSLPLRRSKRLLDQPEEVNYKDVTPQLESRKKRPRVVTPIGRNSSEDATSAIYIAKGVNESGEPRSPPASNSVRGISLSCQHLVLGSNNAPTQTGVLGLPMHGTGKEFVIYKSFEIAASAEDRQRLKGHRLSFNKYSGVQEWKDCVFLWVNLGAKGNTVINKFLKNGQQITWFGGSQMFNETPVIEKLIRWGREATVSSSRIILWCRRYESERKAIWSICLPRSPILPITRAEFPPPRLCMESFGLGSFEYSFGCSN